MNKILCKKNYFSMQYDDKYRKLVWLEKKFYSISEKIPSLKSNRYFYWIESEIGYQQISEHTLNYLSDYLYNSEETINISRTELIDKMLNEY